MPPKYRKKDYVKVLANKFDNDERDKSGMNFSERWAADGNGLWCYGTISRVYVKKRGQPQKYSIKYDGGQSMASTEDQIEPANEEEDDEEADDGESESDRDSGNQSTDSEGQTLKPQEDKDDDVTDDDLGSVNEDNDQNCWMDGNCVQIGESVECGDDDDPKQLTWTRIKDIETDTRTAKHEQTFFKNLVIDDRTAELDIFLALMPVSPEKLLSIVREGAQKANCKLNWNLDHIFAALCIIFGGAQFKEMTDLWSITKKGMMPPPDFGLYLSRDRFERLLRYWAFGPEKCWGELLEKPWTEVQYWVQGFNKARRDELEVGTDLTPDEMMFAWRGKKGNGGIPHLSLVERKPIPLGTELKCVCEGTFGLCMHLEIQTGKISMARKKWCRQYKATTACTVRLLDNMQVRATNIEGKKRCVFADSWFASVETALAVRTELGCDFTGPIKTAHKYFPLEHIRWTLSEMKRGEHVVFKCNEEENLWAIGWHDNHYKAYITTHGTTNPGKPADKKRQDKETNTNFCINIPRPEILAQYNQEMGSVDRHNFYRQGILKLHSTWKTKRWQTRIQLEILAVTLVDAFLACRKLIPRWQHETDDESVFWKFVCHLIPQIDPRPRHERTREEETDPTAHCVQIRLGVKKTLSGKNKGLERAIQGRCTSCRIRKKLKHLKGNSTPTSWGCACHRKEYFCKNKTCWSEHLKAVREKEADMFAI
jgi:hypothetical protein